MKSQDYLFNLTPKINISINVQSSLQLLVKKLSKLELFKSTD